ncbi:Phage capsid family protein [Pseudoalteromonas sp. THAF3]|nr:Phage capsid family protein [Pseudoalteromonas sp. THAF3]
MNKPTPTEKQTRTINEFKGSEQVRDPREDKGYLKLLTEANRSLEIDEEKRTVELAFSSETPYERWFGDEILDHKDGSIDFSRLRSGGAVLMDHNWTDQVGVVESVRIDADGVARAIVRFSRSQRGQEVFNDIIDGIRTNISVGYFVHEMQLEKQGEDKDSYRVTKWEPFEISIVSVPADPTVGIGRSAQRTDPPTPDTAEEGNEPESSDPENPTEEGSEPTDVAPTDEPEGSEPQTPKDEPSSSDSSQTTTGQKTVMTTQTTQTTNDAVQAERTRVAELTAIGDKFGAHELARQAIANGDSVADLNTKILESRGFEAKPAEGTTDLGMDDQDKDRFSFARLINAQANPNDSAAQKAAAFELDVCAQAARKANKEVKGVLIPQEVLSHQRAHSAGSPADGGNLVATDLMSGSFIDLLQNKLAIMGAGATMLTGLEGNIAIPRQTGGAAAFWLAENGEPSETSATFDQIALTPKTVGAYTELSRKLMQQSSLNIEQFVQNELIRVLALEIDRAALNGSGLNNQPKGLLNMDGIGSVVGGDNGAAPLWKHVVDLETAIADENADIGTLRYLTNARVRGKLKQTEITANSGRFIYGADNSMNGYPVTVSNQVPKNGVKGTGTDLSSLIFGNFADLIIGMWGGLDLQVNPYSLDKKGAVRVTAFQDVDTVVRHPESFAAMKDVKTS